jgi:hypothetical protein
MFSIKPSVWEECEEATERGKRCEGDMAFNVSNELPAFWQFQKRDGNVVASLRKEIL